MGTRRALFGISLGSSQKELPEVHIALLGQLGVGKSALTVKYITRRFIMEYDPTLEDTYSKMACLDGQEYTVKVMDTYDQDGQNRERYLKWAHGFIVVYSITNRASFDTARRYLDTIAQYHQRQPGGSTRPPLLALAGNKLDLERYRTVSKTQGENLAREYDTSFFETSAAEDFNSVQQVFHSITRDIARDQQLVLQPLVISEGDRSSLVQQSVTPRTVRSRVKSPKASELGGAGAGTQLGKKADEKEQKTGSTRRPGGALRLFKVNKPFKIFN